MVRFGGAWLVAVAVVAVGAAGGARAEAPPPTESAPPSAPPSPPPAAPAAAPTSAPAPSAPSAGVDLEIARAHFDAGLANYNAGRYAEAVKEFREAHRLSQRPDLLYNIGRAYERLDDVGRATAAYRGYLAARPDAPERADLEQRLAVFAPRVGTLRVRSSVPAEVVVDDTPSGAPGDDVALTAGSHQVEVRSPGYLPANAEVKVTPGAVAEVALEPRPLVATTPLAPPPATPEGPKSRRWLVGVLVGVAAVVVAGAVVGGVAVGGRTDVRANARAGCMSASDCTVVDLSNGAAR